MSDYCRHLDELQLQMMPSSESDVQSKRKRDDGTSRTTQTSVPTFEVEAALASQTPTNTIETQISILPTEERENITSNKQRAEWKEFKLYLTNDGKRRAECKYSYKTFAAESVGDKKGEGKLRNWVLNDNDLREALCLVIVDELPFCCVEKPGFKHLMSVACPEFVLPSRMTVARGCFHLYLKEKEKLKEFLKLSSQRVCVTIDSWTSNQRIIYMCLTAHFIDNDWNLQKRILNFCPITSHRGESIAKAIESCLESWDLDMKLLTVTVDNASSNDVACSHLMRMVQSNDSAISNEKYLHMRCVAHIVNLIVWDGLKIKDSLQAIERIRAAVKFVRNSPARLNKFKEIATILKIESKSLLSLDVPTRWNSTYTMLMSTIKFERVFGMFELHNELDLKEPSNVGPPKESDWLLAKRLVIFLEKFYTLTNNVSASLGVTCNSALFDIGTTLGTLKELESASDLELSAMTLKMKEKFDKYWGSLEKFNMLIYVAVILDPTMKRVGLQLTLHEMYGEVMGDSLLENIQQVLNDLFDEYKAMYFPTVVLSGTSDVIESSDMRLDLKAKVRKLKFSLEAKGKYSTRPELDRYLNEEADEEDIEILTWWKLNSLRFPVVLRMARDILAIPVSTVASEAAFSTGGQTLDQFRSSLTPKMVQGLICSQDWLRATLKNKSKIINVEESLEELQDLENDLQKCGIDESIICV